tara:strand:- start:11409 stop:11657 length:249 start_codon:yes stop_codon:yes gene_type:complete
LIQNEPNLPAGRQEIKAYEHLSFVLILESFFLILTSIFLSTTLALTKLLLRCDHSTAVTHLIAFSVDQVQEDFIYKNENYFF